MVKVLVLTGFGINCEEETAAAYHLAGAHADIIHFNQVLLKGHSIHHYDVIHFPGGFSFGDDLASGKVMANKIRYKKLQNGKTLLDELKIFLNRGNFIMGICNGFQMLVRLGLLPNTNLYFEQQATLAHNDSAKYEDRWIYCKVNQQSVSPFLKGIEIIPLPVRHGEGKLIFSNETSLQIVKTKALNCLTYCLEDGTTATEYPHNPNGAELSCAGLIDPTGQVFGLMPHPEAFLSLYNHPNWGQLKRTQATQDETGWGLQFFTNIVQHIQAHKYTNS